MIHELHDNQKFLAFLMNRTSFADAALDVEAIWSYSRNHVFNLKYNDINDKTLCVFKHVNSRHSFEFIRIATCVDAATMPMIKPCDEITVLY